MLNFFVGMVVLVGLLFMFYWVGRLTHRSTGAHWRGVGDCVADGFFFCLALVVLAGILFMLGLSICGLGNFTLKLLGVR